MLPSNFSTSFDIVFPATSHPGVNPYSARGLRGTLRPIDMAAGNDKLARTVNGTLVSIAATQMRKYKLEVNGEDDAPPALDGLWVGMLVTVNCHVELAYLTAGGAPAHPAVPDSLRFDGDYAYYSPQFQMLVVELHVERQEWASVVSWSLVLEEI